MLLQTLLLKREIYSQGCPTPQETCTLGLWPGCWTVVICDEDAVGELVLAAPHIPRAPGEELLDGICRDFPQLREPLLVVLLTVVHL